MYHDGCGVSCGQRWFTSYLAFALLDPLLLSCLHLSSRWLSFSHSILLPYSPCLLFSPNCLLVFVLLFDHRRGAI
jgi:hypothetical protein